MASTPQFGGTNGVTELDVGQPGSARATANSARFTVRMSLSREENRQVVNELPQQAAAFRDSMGAGAKHWEWRGRLKVDTLNLINLIRDELSQYKDGYGRTDGDPTTFDEDFMKPTVLKDFGGNQVTSRAVLVEFGMGRVVRITGDANFTYATDLWIRFRTL